jgi:DNA primase
MEGYLDVARAIEAGVEEVVATCGTALTAGHARLVHRFADRVIVNFDQDAAGQKAARKSVDILIEEGLAVQVVELPEGHDPDTYLKAEGAAAYRERLAAAPAYMEWLIKRAARENDTKTPAGKAAYLESLLPTLGKIESAVERAAWLPAIVERGGLDGRAAQEELRRAVASRATSAPAAVAAATAPPPRAGMGLLPAEKWLLALILRRADGIQEALAELQEADVAGLRSAEVLRAAMGISLRGEALTAAALDAALPGDEARRLVREVAVENPPVDEARPRECVLELRRRVLSQRLAEIQKDLQAAPQEAVEALLQEKLVIRRQIANL